MQTDPLFIVRKKIAIYSFQKSHERIQKQKHATNNYDQTELDEQFDQLVYSNMGYENICTAYGDESSVTRGKFSRDGKLYVTVGGSGEGKVWNVQNQKSIDFGKEICELKGIDKLCDVDLHPNINSIPAFAPNIITSSNTGDIYVWTFDPNLKSQKSIKIKGHSDRINNIKFHQSTTMFLTASYDKSWSIWDSSRIKQISNQKGHNKQIHTLSLHPDGSLIFTGDLGGEGMIWDLRTGRGIYEIDITNSIVCSSFNPNGFQFAVAGKNNLIQIFDIRRKKLLKQIPAHLKLVSDLTFSQNGAILFSASHDMKVKLWHGRNYSLIDQELEHPGKISSISYSNGRLGVTMLDRKWTLWSNNKAKQTLMEGQEQKVKLQTQNQANNHQ